jgi:hypothetical protein
MARLTSDERKKIPSSKFAGPGRSFPIEDKTHAIAAERLAPRSERAGNISADEEHKIVAKAKRKLSGAHALHRLKGKK